MNTKSIIIPNGMPITHNSHVGIVIVTSISIVYYIQKIFTTIHYRLFGTKEDCGSAVFDLLVSYSLLLFVNCSYYVLYPLLP